jgi:alkanesulfonate monooxygenase SsuD/methylene tetrahydromethanopterin reductase-like flavin-dependent oxidoreductase (luciferase family)
LTNDLCGLDVIDQEAIEVAGRALRPAAYLPGPVLAGDNANLNDDREAAIDESKRFLDLYYTTDFVRDFVAVWTACGSVDQVVEHLRMYRDLGFHEVTLCPTAWDQQGQLTRVIDEVIPRLN